MGASMIYVLAITMLLAGIILVVGYAGRDANPDPDPDPSRNNKR